MTNAKDSEVIMTREMDGRGPVGLGIAVAAVVIGIAMTATCSPSGPGGSSGATIAGMPVRVECPLTDSIIVDTPYVATATSVISLAGPLSHIPEFHDCQRFVLKRTFLFWTTWKYDSLYAVFASHRLDSLWLDSSTAVGGLPPTGCNSSMINDSSSLCFEKPLGAQIPVAGTGRPFVEIVSWGGTYTPLGIGPGYNCLYLFDPSAPRAFMVRQGLDDDTCDPPATYPTGPNVKELEVRRDTLPKYVAAHYPAVARWDWDTRNSEQYIGVRCGAAWCEVGDKGFVSSTEYAASTNWATTPVRRRLVDIKGWYDQQRLDIGNPSMIRGNAFPAPGLDTLKIKDFHHNWVPTAFISLASAHTKYRTTFNFEFATIGPLVDLAQLDTIELCQGTQTDRCTGVPDTLSCTVSAPPDSLWWARIKPAGVARPWMYKCVVRRGHEGLGDKIPGTVRWRWTADDETTWMRCDAGCCEVHP